MRSLALASLLGAGALVAGCATYPASDAVAQACGTYGYVDANNDGVVTAAEWDAYRTGSYSSWDTNRDGRIRQVEFQSCWNSGGFYRSAYYKPEYWNNYWTGFDANGDGYLSNDEYWSAAAWARADRNRNGRIDADEWQWWM